jgi:hypothetical protein
MDPRCFSHWPWNQKCDTECPQDIAHSEIYHEFFTNKDSVVVEVPKCLEGFVWTGVRFTTREPDAIKWYPLGIVLPPGSDAEKVLLHTIFIQYGEWNIIPIEFGPHYIELLGKPLLKFQFPSNTSGKIELLAQKLG